MPRSALVQSLSMVLAFYSLLGDQINWYILAIAGIVGLIARLTTEPTRSRAHELLQSEQSIDGVTLPLDSTHPAPKIVSNKYTPNHGIAVLDLVIPSSNQLELILILEEAIELNPSIQLVIGSKSLRQLSSIEITEHLSNTISTRIVGVLPELNDLELEIAIFETACCPRAVYVLRNYSSILDCSYDLAVVGTTNRASIITKLIDL